MMRNRFSSACRRASIGAAATGSLLLLSLTHATPARAELKEIVIAPAAPTTCDSVSITVAGTTPDPCYEVVGAVIRGPDEFPCAGPRPCPFGFRVEITVREPNPDSERACPTVITPYTRSFNVGRLRAGEYLVAANERVIPYAADSTDSIVSESSINARFAVRPDSVCTPGPGCYILDFRPDRGIDPVPGTFCTAVTPPGGTACLAVTLMNTHAVGGLQTTLEVTSADGTSADRFIRPVSVAAVGRATNGFELAWVAEGSKTRILLYPMIPGASIPPGDGPLLRICYSVAPETPPQMFRIHDFPTIVADPTGGTFQPCPTFRATGGILCVSSTGCDINGDGVSDVLDVIHLVRCALAGDNDSSSTCPDSIATRADCNGDGSVDIRDVICCVRKIVATPGAPRIGTSGATSAQANAIGFEGGVRWINAAEGTATVRLDAGDDWGGTQFSVGPSLGPLRIRGLKLVGTDPTAPMEWAIDGFGTAHAMIYATTSGARSARSYRVEVTFERTEPGTATLELGDIRAGTSAGAPAAVTLLNTSLMVSEAPAAAPTLLPARPNPSAGQTEIGFVLPADARVKLHVYDVAGRLVRTLIDTALPAGVHRARWDGTDNRGRAARSGIYFTKFVVEKTVRSERIMLLR